ncbi:IQ calmodulin-binding motif protein (macronuclear) [Tetrahymena thermophila SB210]|uniref:IQ calmodulin-binding motif protein n=1 Tax=Tetrahymena thermophila (strain SB210) TaxID=312017 RepID=I7M1H0_TETTS|nr:IQ calmodulin-binding motif protein [Tetrahymena thermophila SB210]EAR96332.2 IQ calmodulin-binding motif protein [Tetrahymena thermophila SB210]|eukprot:XP_001016577.2 IQ calmodulin-binding motif protein [Tetrahymena thermophila SB210]
MSDILNQIPQLILNRKKQQKKEPEIGLDNDIFLGLDNIENIDQKFKIYSESQRRNSFVSSPNYNRSLSINKVLNANSKQIIQISDTNRTEKNNLQPKDMKLTSIKFINDFKQDNVKPSVYMQSPKVQQNQIQSNTDQVYRLKHGFVNNIYKDKSALDENQPAFMINKKRNSFSSHAAINYKSQTSIAINQAHSLANQKENNDKLAKNLTFKNEVQKCNNITKSNFSIPQKDKQETQVTEQSLNFSKQKLSIKDLATFQRNLMISRNIQALKRNLIEINGDNALNSSRSNKDQSYSTSQFANLATLIYDIITSTNSFGNFMKNPFAISIPNVEKVFNQFNIDKKKLVNLKTMEEKEEYIVTQIYSQSIEQLKQMIEKINKKTDEFAQIEEREKEKGKYKKNMNELFSWIQIPGSYEALKNKVKYSLVEVLYGHNNLQQLQELQQKNEEYNNNIKALKEGTTHRHLSTLGEFQENQQQFNDTLNYLGSLTLNKKIRSVHLKIEDDLNRTSQSLLKVEQRKLTTISGQSIVSSKYQKTDSSSNKPQQVASPKCVPKNFSEQVQNFDDQQFKDADVILKEKLKNFQWDYQNERTFQSYKKNAKKTFVGLDSMNRWQQIGMQPIIQKLGLEEKLDLYREQLQEKYQRGENLKESEKIFIINTSQLLISNIDKEYFQGMLDFICEEDILKLEQIIAENIILKYETIAQYLKNQRNQYLQEKADASANKIEKSNVTNIYNKIKDEQKIKYRQKELKDNVEQIKRRLERKFESIQFYEKLRKNLYVQHFVNQLKKAIAYKELGQKKFVKEESYYKNFAKRNYPSKKEKVLFTITNNEEEIPITTKESQKIYHPTSKLLLGLNNLAKIEEAQKSGRNRNYLIDMPPKQQKQLEMQRATYEQFTNRLQDCKKLENFQAKFTEYYSNGPIDSRDLKNKNLQVEKKKDLTADGSQQEVKFKKPHLWITREIEEKCAIIIQKWVRRFLQQKKYNYELQQIKDSQEKKMFTILKQWKDSKELMNFIKNHTLQVARQKKLTLNKNQIKNATFQSQSQPNSPRSNTSSVSMINNNQNVKEKQKEKLGGNVFVKSHRKQVSEYTFNQINQNANQHLDRSDSISSINSKQSKHSYLGSATSTRIGGTITHDFSIYGLHGYNATKKKSIKSTDDSINQITHGRSVSDFQSPKSALFYSKQFFPASTAVMSNYLGESQHNNLTVKELKEQIDEDVNMENEQLQCDEQFKNNKQMLQQQLIDQQKNIPIQLQRKVSLTANQLKHQINKIKSGVKDFSKKREELLLKQKKLFYAVKQGNIQIIKNSGFVYYPHDVNTIDDKGNCPLYYATKRGNEELIDFLLRQGADVNIRCQEGNTPVHLAFSLGNEKVIMSFLDKGGDLNCINNIGQTPLAFAPIKLLKLIGLDKGITNIEPQKIGQRIDFDNNKIFIETHNIIDTSNHVKEANSNITIVKKRKEKQAHEEIPEKDLYFQFIPTNSTLDLNNYDKFAQGIKILQKSPKTGNAFNQIQSFVEPQQRQQKKEENEFHLEFTPKPELIHTQAVENGI